MDWKAALVAFIVVFVSELGDKTQLATMAVASRSKSPGMVFVGAAGALVLSALLGVLAGESLSRWAPPDMLRLAAGAGFVALGITLLLTG